MLLAVNIGNTNIRFGVFREKGEITTWILNSKPYRTEDECFAKFSSMYAPFGLDKEDVTDIVIASVVPPLTKNVGNALHTIHGIEPMIVNRETPSNVQHTSNQMGTDLYANAVAAQSFYKGKKLVIDFGTALTFIAIGETGETLGVVIGPGVKTALNSLVGETAQLPEIDLIAPKKVLGMDTESCMQSGLVFGFTSLVEGMIDRINKEVGAECQVIATGGLSFTFAPLTNKIHVQDQLHTLKGIAELYRLNKNKK